jgi:hypothetical protein
MFYLIIWLILWLITGAGSFTFGNPVFWSFIVALLADLLIRGWPYISRGR